MPLLFPPLLAIVKEGDQYGPHIQQRALVILYSMLDMMGALLATHKAQVTALLQPSLPAWSPPLHRHPVHTHLSRRGCLPDIILGCSDPLCPVHLQASGLGRMRRGQAA